MDDLPCNMTFSSVDRDRYSRLSNGRYGSVQVSNGGGGSDVSSPAEDSAEASYLPAQFQVVQSGSLKSKRQKALVRYHECQKNHAASLGGHAVDGCGEFLPGGKEGTLEALECAACFCHRNFHRREFVTTDTCICGASRSLAVVNANPYLHSHAVRPISPGLRESKAYQPSSSSADISPHAHAIVPLARFEDDEDDDDEPPQHPGPSLSKKKRFRTKFTPEQKERMFCFAEALGWRISKQDEDVVDSFCNDVGVKRNVFKVWMHNNKHDPRKKQAGGSELDRNCDSPPDY